MLGNLVSISFQFQKDGLYIEILWLFSHQHYKKLNKIAIMIILMKFLILLFK